MDDKIVLLFLVIIGAIAIITDVSSEASYIRRLVR
jgi:hypothetical protein